MFGLDLSLPCFPKGSCPGKSKECGPGKGRQLDKGQEAGGAATERAEAEAKQRLSHFFLKLQGAALGPFLTGALPRTGQPREPGLGRPPPRLLAGLLPSAANIRLIPEVSVSDGQSLQAPRYKPVMRSPRLVYCKAFLSHRLIY